ncbi:MAG: methyltransferase domain-containing protein [Candidatus Methanosuratincola petrocarbonis]
MTGCYVHGYSDREAERLSDQAATLSHLLHFDTSYQGGRLVLEAGCGTGSQSRILAASSPHAVIISLDISRSSLLRAGAELKGLNAANIRLLQADVFRLPFDDETFDDIFVCFLLEHLTEPDVGLAELYRVLKKGGTITVIEGDHGSCYFHPETPEALMVWRCLIDVQASIGCNSLIGRQLYPLLRAAGFAGISVSPRMVYSDETHPRMMEGFVRRTIIPMVEGVRDQAISAGMTDRESWDKGIADLHRTAEPPTGTFCYTFFKAKAVK